MILTLCLDEKLGMAFNGRRQSRDRLLIEDLTGLAAGAPVYMHPRSSPLFENSGANAVPCENFGEKAGDGEYCFLEFSAPSLLEPRAEKLIIYRWNRRYQADLSFDIDLSQWKMESSEDFPGSSHEIITREEYTREYKARKEEGRNGPSSKKTFICPAAPSDSFGSLLPLWEQS